MVAALVAVGWVGWNVHRYVNVTVPNAYAMQWTGGLVIQHLRQHGDAWPEGWSDLKVAYDELHSDGNTAWPFETLHERIEVDFDANPKALAAVPGPGEEPPFLVVGVKGGDDVSWSDWMEPNFMIHAYLQRRDGYEEFPATEP